MIRLIQAEAERIIQSTVSTDELYRAKESLKGHMVLGLESTGSRMMRLGKSEVTHGEILSLDELVARVDAVDEDSVLRVAQATLGGPRVLAMVAPFAAEKVAHLLG